jgi:hypothetical protein
MSSVSKIDAVGFLTAYYNCRSSLIRYTTFNLMFREEKEFAV